LEIGKKTRSEIVGSTKREEAQQKGDGRERERERGGIQNLKLNKYYSRDVHFGSSERERERERERVSSCTSMYL
jgi:hypothetical protein